MHNQELGLLNHLEAALVYLCGCFLDSHDFMSKAQYDLPTSAPVVLSS